MSTTRILLAALAAVGVIGCDSGGSSDDGSSSPSTDEAAGTANPPTSEIQLGATFDARTDVAVDVRVNLSGLIRSRSLILGTGNVLTACVGTVCRPLTRNDTTYRASLPYVPETAYTFSLSRQDHVSAPNSFVTLPVPYTILSPPAGSRVTDGEMITLQWSPPVINGRLRVSGDATCVHPSGEATSRSRLLLSTTDSDPGIVSFPMDAIMTDSPYPTPRDSRVERCSVALTVSTERTGVADSAFYSGTVVGRYERTVVIEYVPLP